MKTEEGASFLEWGETNMVSHRPRKRTWTNQTKGDQRRKNLGEKGPMNAVQHSPCAKSAPRGGAQRSLRHHRRLQRSEIDGPARLAARQVYTSKFASEQPGAAFVIVAGSFLFFEHRTCKLCRHVVARKACC